MIDLLSTLDLWSECEVLGIRLLLSGGSALTIDAPQNTLTPDLIHRLTTHKDALLSWLQSRPSIGLTDAESAWHAALDQLESDPLFPPKMLEALRGALVRWEQP